MIRFILMDIEGTTTSISFVHDVLFPYAHSNLPAFIHSQKEHAKVKENLQAVIETVQEEENQVINEDQAIQKLLSWIESDRKHTALKNLQGFLWKTGYENGDYKAHVYPDVVPCWKDWVKQGFSLGIYSSGSVKAQHLLFQYAEEGDLRGYLTTYFDTTIGHKKEVASYIEISKRIGLGPSEILFLSDVEAELDAARAAGFRTIQIIRPGTKPGLNHPLAVDFPTVARILNGFPGLA